ncbi:hypothetical protein [Rahnella aquatilis]
MKQALEAFPDNIQGIIDAPDYYNLRHQFEEGSLHVRENSLLFMER